MKKTKLVGLVVLGISLGLGGTSVLAKGHDMGVADGGPRGGLDPKTGEVIPTGMFSRGGTVSSVVGQSYGQRTSVLKGGNRVIPVVTPRGGNLKR